MVAVKYDAQGLVPVVAQDATTGEVLMVAYMNAEAVQRTADSGDAWYWSRSRGRLWRKGEESGHTQRVREMRVDCDNDALLLVVDQNGPACHTGHRSCFYRDLAAGGETDVAPTADGLRDLFARLERRRQEMRDGSYTVTLLRGGGATIAAKVQEESGEVIHAALAETNQRLVEETADLLYHTLVLLLERGVPLDDVYAELDRRRHDR
ncbi:MAG TPA: bifunctional phosphoribosyl-AMP cyclohydrolase/phosphoribosyl-ATP diphosphatase HisIE [bacterium]